MDANLKNLDRDHFIANEAECVQQFLKQENWQTVPILNYTPLYALKDGVTVRFRGIIQDMLEDETYLQQYEVTNNETNEKHLQIGKYRDVFNIKPNESVNLNASSNVFANRKLLYMVSIPHLNSWALEFESKINNDINNVSKSDTDHRLKKRTLQNDEKGTKSDNSLDENDDMANSKRLCANNISNNDLNGAGCSHDTFNFNSILSKAPNTSCVVKLYSVLDNYLLNSFIEVLGFLSFEDSTNKSNVRPNSNDIDEEMEELEGINSIPYHGPQIHITAIRKLNNLNPLLDMGLSNTDNTFTDKFESILNSLQVTLTQCLFGDKLAAQYLIGHLISTIYVRTENHTLGQFSLNIFNVPSDENLSEYTKTLYGILEMLLPASLYLPMTLENMNTLSFVPKKNYRTSKLETGVLQLADHTQIMLDETKLQPGKLESNGVHGVKSLSNLIEKQQVFYDFEFYKIGFQTNIPVLIMSEGRSMLPSNCNIPLKYDSESLPVIMETLKAAKHYIQSKLFEIRQYLTGGKLIEFSIASNVSRMIENDFVEMRTIDETIGSEYLHILLVLSRLMGIASGKLQLDKDAWQMAKDMERERRLRLTAISRN